MAGVLKEYPVDLNIYDISDGSGGEAFENIGSICGTVALGLGVIFVILISFSNQYKLYNFREDDW